jgi:hypothetical protein
MYLNDYKDFGEFCEKVLHMSKSNVNRLIAVREELGDRFFYITQLTRIPEREYRAIAPAITEEGIHWKDAFIPLNGENSGRIAEAVAGLRAEAAAEREKLPTANQTPPKPLDVQDRIDLLGATADQLIQSFREVRRGCSAPHPYLTSSVILLRQKVSCLLVDIEK